jgi:hypothetical protein
VSNVCFNSVFVVHNRASLPIPRFNIKAGNVYDTKESDDSRGKAALSVIGWLKGRKKTMHHHSSHRRRNTKSSQEAKVGDLREAQVDIPWSI